MGVRRTCIVARASSSCCKLFRRLRVSPLGVAAAAVSFNAAAAGALSAEDNSGSIAALSGLRVEASLVTADATDCAISFAMSGACSHLHHKAFSVFYEELTGRRNV